MYLDVPSMFGEGRGYLADLTFFFVGTPRLPGLRRHLYPIP